MTIGAGRLGLVQFRSLSQCQPLDIFLFRLLQFRNVGRWRWNRFPEDPLQDPVTASNRTCSIGEGGCRQGGWHAEDTTSIPIFQLDALHVATLNAVLQSVKVGERAIEIGVVGVNKLENGPVFVDDTLEKKSDLIQHRFAEFRGQFRENFKVKGLVGKPSET